MTAAATSSIFLGATMVMMLVVVCVASPTPRQVGTCEDQAREVIDIIYGGKLAVPCVANKTHNYCGHLPVNKLRDRFHLKITCNNKCPICATKFDVSSGGLVNVTCSSDCEALSMSSCGGAKIHVACYHPSKPSTVPKYGENQRPRQSRRRRRH